MVFNYCFSKSFVFQKRDDARQFMKFLHPDLGVGNAFELHKTVNFPYWLAWIRSFWCW